MDMLTEPDRSCADDRCQVRETCQLWADRDAPGFRVRALTWRPHWQCFDLACPYHLPLEADGSPQRPA